MDHVQNTTFHEAFSLFNISDIGAITAFNSVLDELSKALAVDEGLRARMGSAEPDLWSPLRRLWLITSAAHSGPALEDEDTDWEDTLRSLCISLARFTRNLVAAVPHNQEHAFENEPPLRELIRHYTSYAALQDPRSIPATRMLSQCLCNMVTANEKLLGRLWTLYLGLPEEQLILTRLLSVPDAGTASSTFVLILNCLHESADRIELLVDGQSGPRLVVSFLDRIQSLFDAENSTDNTRAFEIGYSIFCRVAAVGIIPKLYARIAVEDEVVTPHQTTLLKLLDSYLQPSQTENILNEHSQLRDLCAFLTDIFFALCQYTQHAISRAIGPNPRHSSVSETASAGSESLNPGANSPRDHSLSNVPLEELDLLLPKVCEALVLVTQCLISLSLYSEDTLAAPPKSASDGDHPSFHLKDTVISATASATGVGAVETLIQTLRMLDLFLPRITLGKAAPAAVPVGKQREGAAQLRDGREDVDIARARDPKGFAYLKRDLVRLLGILAADRRAVQDRVRVCGGIPVVLNLCVIDERNPYLREHAIFTLRNLLHGNADNQALVNEIQPISGLESMQDDAGTGM